MTLLIVGVASVAHLSSVAARANTQARTTTVASLLAVEKIEQLRALAWSVDLAGQPVSDISTDVTVFPPSAGGGAGLTASPASSLTTTSAGYCDFLDAAGRVVPAVDGVAASAVYVRRWSITPLPDDPANTIVLQVLVTRHPSVPGTPPPDSARIVTVKTRKPL